MKTIINGKEIKILGRQEIGLAFTQKVNEYLSKGFIFNCARSSGGTQGEEMKACLSNDGGKTVFIIFLENVYGGFRDADKMIIQVRKYEDCNDNSTLWLSKGEEIEKIIFYALERRHCGKERFVENLEDYEAIRAIQDERFSIKSSMTSDKILPEKYYKLALKVIKKRKGYKSRQLKDVMKVVKRNPKSRYVYLYGIQLKQTGFVYISNE